MFNSKFLLLFHYVTTSTQILRQILCNFYFLFHYVTTQIQILRQNLMQLFSLFHYVTIFDFRVLQLFWPRLTIGFHTNKKFLFLAQFYYFKFFWLADFLFRLIIRLLIWLKFPRLAVHCSLRFPFLFWFDASLRSLNLTSSALNFGIWFLATAIRFFSLAHFFVRRHLLCFLQCQLFIWLFEYTSLWFALGPITAFRVQTIQTLFK